MKQKQLMTAMLSLCMVTNMCGTVFADNVTYEEKRGTPVTISLENGEDLTADEFVVKVPKKVRASKNENVNYTVTVSGKLKSDHVLHVVPNGVVKLTSGDSDIVLESKVTQDKTDFDSEELEVYDEVVADGSVGTVGRVDGGDIDEVKGSYSGNMIFSISVDDGTTTEVVKFGLFDDNGNVIKSWDDIISEGYYKVTDGLLDMNSSTVFEEKGIRVQDLYGNLIIPDDIGIAAIDDGAFSMTYSENDRGITSVTIPEGVTKIGDDGSIFGGNNRIETVIMPDTVTEICPDMFNNCTNLKTVKLSNNINYLPNRVFVGCSSLESITIPDSVTSFGESVFSCCTSLKSVNLPDTLTTLDGTFYGCTSLESITIPSGITSVYQPFVGCTNLKNVTIQNGMAKIPADLFYKCTGLESIVIPDSVADIGDGAFYECTSLDSLTIPATVTAIGKDAFSGIPLVYYAGSATGSPWGATQVSNAGLLSSSLGGGYKSWDQLVADGNVIVDGTAIVACGTSMDGKLIIHDSIKAISTYAFQNCSELTEVIVPSGMQSIDNYAFRNCTSLKRINISDTMMDISEGCFYNCDTLEVNIPSNIIIIGINAFYNVKHIEYHGSATGSPWGAKSMN